MILPPHILEAIEAAVLTGPAQPYFDLEGYMRRVWVQPPIETGPNKDCATRMHEILRSDDDRCLHDHPWDSTSIILTGGYWEVTFATEAPLYEVANFKHETDYFITDRHFGYMKATWYGPGAIIQRKAQDYHRLILPEGKTARTLFITGPYRQSWGFMTASGKVNWRTYLGVEAEKEYESKNPFQPHQ